MSSFRVSNDHLSMLVSAANRSSLSYRPRWRTDSGGWATVGKPRESTPNISTVSPQELGEMLARWNDSALEARYGDAPGPAFAWNPADDIGPLDPVKALKALDCLEYQCAEFEGWDDCEAYRFAQALRRSLISRLPGYDDAEWGVVRWGYAAAKEDARAKIEARKLAQEAAQ
jgi:hypothetical protein